MNKNHIMGDIFKLMGGYRIVMLLGMILSAIAAVVKLNSYLCVYHVASEIVTCGGDFSVLNQEYLKNEGFRAVFLISMSFGLYGMALLCSHITAFCTIAKLRVKLIRHIGSLSMGYHAKNPSGKQREIIEKLTDNMEKLIAHQLPDCVQSMVLPIAFLGYIFRNDVWLSIICLIPIFLGFGILAYMLKDESEGFVKEMQSASQNISNAATEYVRGISVVKVFGQTAESFQRYKNAVKAFEDYMLKYALSMEHTDSIYNTIINGVFFFLMMGGLLLYNHTGNTGQILLSFVFFAVIIPVVSTILGKIMKSSSEIMISSSSLETINGILEEKPLSAAAVPQSPANYDISLEHVSFSYEENAPKALDDVSLTIKQGSITALVGESGGGKSTVANLIARFYDVQEGAVRVGGVDIRDMDYDAWMKKVSIVFQDNSILKMSVLDNVKIYCPQASREEVMRALQLAQCEDIVKRLPQGVDTVIGTEGIYLSGGEIQRIAIARAILKDAPVVLLDEATAFADAENEYLIKKALDELLKGKTVLMIAHRLSTITHADEICVLQRGQVVERGRHAELLQRNGVYAAMFEENQKSITWKIAGARG